MNRAAEDMCDASWREPAGTTIWQCFPHTAGTPFEAGLRRAMEQRQNAAFDYFHASAKRWFECRAYAAGDGLIVLLTGADERKLRHEELERNATVYRSLFETTLDGILIVNDEGRYVEVNDSYCRFLKADRESLIGAHFSNFIPPDRLAEAQEAFAALQKGRATPVDFPLLATDGSIVELEWTSATNFVQGLHFCACRDIGERKRHEEELRRSEERLRLAQQAARMDSWSFELGDRVAADAYSEWLRHVHPGDREPVAAAVEAAIQNGVDEFAAVYRLADGDGHEHWREARGRIHRDPSGTPSRAHGISMDISGQKRAQEEQRWLSEQLQTIIKASPLPIVTCTCAGNVTLWNPAAERLFGWTAEEALGGPLPFIPREKREEHLRMRERDLKGESFTNLEIRRVRKDGIPIDISVSTAPLHDAAGQMTGFISLYVDVTERKVAERELQSAAGRLSLTLEASRMGDWSWDPSTDRVTLSNRAAAILGLASGAAIARGDLRALIHEHDRDLAHREFDRCLNERADYDVEYRVNTDDGVRWISAKGRGLFAADGETRGMLGVLQDITERKQAESQLLELHRLEQEARRTAEHLYRVGPLLAAELDVEKLAQKITDIAREACGAEFGALFHNVTSEAGDSYMLYTLSGAPRERFTGFPMPRSTAVFAPTFRGEGIVRSDDITQDPRYGKNAPRRGIPEGHLPVRSYLAVPVVSRSGEVMGGLFFGHSQTGMFHETHEKLINGIAGQAAIAMDNARLFEAVRQSEAALRRSNEELRRTNEDLEHFAYSASHDLREPLRQVAVYSQLLQREYVTRLDARAEQFIELIVGGAKRMEALVRDILAYTQAANIGQGEIEVIDADAALSAVIGDLKSAIDDSSAVIETEPLPAIRVKPIHLQQLFQNLISNALKYRGPEPPRIRVGAERSGDEWIFFCADNGMGIEAQYHRHIFVLFKRLHSNADFEGTGIGLAICQKIVERYGGRIWVESEAGKGATFRFALPAADA